MTALSTRVQALSREAKERAAQEQPAAPVLAPEVALVPAAGLDCETYLIQPGRAAPQLVVCGYETPDGVQSTVVQAGHAQHFLAWTERLLADRMPLVGHNVAAFDLAVIAADAYERNGPDVGDAVMRRIFELLDAGLVEDTLLRERLIDLAEGTLGKDFDNATKDGNPRRKSYGLKSLAKRYLGVDLDKTSWRTGYAALDGVPLDAWPKGARDYVVDDVTVARRVADAQAQRAGVWRIPNSSEQSKAAFAFQLISTWGLRTDPQAVRQYDADLDREARRFQRIVRAGPFAGRTAILIDAEVALGRLEDGLEILVDHPVSLAIPGLDHADRFIGAVVRAGRASDAGRLVDDHRAAGLVTVDGTGGAADHADGIQALSATDGNQVSAFETWSIEIQACASIIVRGNAGLDAFLAAGAAIEVDDHE